MVLLVYNLHKQRQIYSFMCLTNANDVEQAVNQNKDLFASHLSSLYTTVTFLASLNIIHTKGWIRMILTVTLFFCHRKSVYQNGWGRRVLISKCVCEVPASLCLLPTHSLYTIYITYNHCLCDILLQSPRLQFPHCGGSHITVSALISLHTGML